MIPSIADKKSVGILLFVALILFSFAQPSGATEMIGELMDSSRRLPSTTKPVQSEQVERKENLFIFVFKNGSAQAGITVKVGETELTTNSFGLSAFTLPKDSYEVGYYQGETLFAIADVDLLDDLQTQVFLNLTSEGADAEFDLPITEYDQSFEQAEVKEQTGPKGRLKLLVTDGKDKSPVVNAKLFFKGYSVEATTSAEGIADVELSEGVYDISVIHPRYVMKVMKDISVTANKITSESLALNKSDIVLEEYLVTAPVVEGSLAASFSGMKDSAALTDAISSEQFSKAGDSSASGALKRVTGITIVDDKFVFVRGLGERYSSIRLNGLSVPSPEPTKRVVPLDIFPTDVIQSLDIQKTYSSDMPGTFGGGSVSIWTKDIPKEDNFIKGSIGVSVKNETGEEVFYNSDNDESTPQVLLDLSDGFADLEKQLVLPNGQVLREGLSDADVEELETAMVSHRNYGLDRSTLKPGTSLSGTVGQSFRTRNGLKYGFAGNVYYKADEGFRFIGTDEYQFNQSTGDIELQKSRTYDVTKLEEQLGGLLSVGFETVSGHKFKYTFLSVDRREDVTNFRQQTDFDEGRDTNTTFLDYSEIKLSSHQINGSHPFGEDFGGLFDNVEIDWGYGISTASRLDPGSFEYERKEVGSVDELVLDDEKIKYRYTDLEDEEDNYRIDLKLPYLVNNRDASTSVGFYVREKTRYLDTRNFNFSFNNEDNLIDIDQFLTEENAAADDDLNIKKNFIDADFYEAEQDLNAFYVSQVLEPIEKLSLNFGVRVEESEQRLFVGDDAEEFVLETDDTLPFLQGTYKLTEEHQFRMAFSETLSRPDFREFSPNRYKDPLTGDVVFGNAELRATSITNFDLSYQWYPSFDELVSVGVFVKDFTDPIETVRERADEEIEVSYRNAESAESYGLELGLRKRLDEYSDRLANFFFEGNYTYIESEIDLNKEGNPTDTKLQALTTSKRPMQGQSPYIFNLKFGYDNFYTGRSAILLYNVYGERISILGIEDNPDTYEYPFHRLDFVMKWGLNDTYDDQSKKIGYTLTFKAKNLLDSDVTYSQGPETSFLYKPGRAFSLGLSAKY